MDGGQIAQGEQHREGADQQVLRAVVGQLADVEEVVGHPAHDLAGLVVVKEAEGQPLQVTEQVPAHLGLHLGAHHVALVLDEVVQQHPHEVQPQQRQPGDHHHPVVPVGDQVVEHPPGHDGVDHRDHRHQQRRPHIQGKEQLVGFIVVQKTSQHILSPVSLNARRDCLPGVNRLYLNSPARILSNVFQRRTAVTLPQTARAGHNFPLSSNIHRICISDSVLFTPFPAGGRPLFHGVFHNMHRVLHISYVNGVWIKCRPIRRHNKNPVKLHRRFDESPHACQSGRRFFPI